MMCPVSVRQSSRTNFAELDEYLNLLRCPGCAAPIRRSASHLACSLPTCKYAANGFLEVDGQPILLAGAGAVVNENIIRSSNGASLIGPRSSGKVARILDALRLSSVRASYRNCEHFLSIVRAKGEVKPVILVVGGGCRGSGTESLYNARNITLLSFDIYASPNTQFVADAHSIPLVDGCVDGVWIQAVLEHVVEPTTVANEIFRVLSSDGIVYSEIPFIQHVHEGAYDFTRFTLSGHRYLFRRFSSLASGVIGGIGTQLNWAIDRFVRGLTRSVFLGKIAKALFIWLVWFDHVASRPHSVDAASGTFFLGRKSTHVLSHSEIVDFYQGRDRD